MRRVVDLTGRQIGHLFVVKQAGRSKDGHVLWRCVCDCGEIVTATSGNLRHQKHCQRCSGRTHGLSDLPEYAIYMAAKMRCTNPNDKDYSDYGGRGIHFRFKSFAKFFDEVGFRPSATHLLDRINNDGDYKAGNVRWATPAESAANRRPRQVYPPRNALGQFIGEAICMAQ